MPSSKFSVQNKLEKFMPKLLRRISSCQSSMHWHSNYHQYFIYYLDGNSGSGNSGQSGSTSTDWTIFYPHLIPLIVSSNGAYSDPLCKTFNNGVCTECSLRSYYHPINKVCTQVDPNCNTYNNITGACTGCYSGYKPQNGGCVEEPSSWQPQSQNCRFRSVPINGVCV